MQSRNDADAATIFQKVRRGADPRSLLQNIEVGDVILQLKVTPDTRFRFEFPWKAGMPESLLAHENPYLGSLLYEAAFTTKDSAPAAADSLQNRFMPQYLKPYSAAKLVDRRLDSIKPSKWTNVSDNDELMRELLRLYFMHEYSWFGAFHMDHFLDDMASGSTLFCSSLLVNAVLAYAYVCLIRAQASTNVFSTAIWRCQTAANTGIREPWATSSLPKRSDCGSWSKSNPEL
jgi:hypothetical protein